MPDPIQLRRSKGWRLPAGAVAVARPGRWGNPFLVADVARAFPSLTTEQCRGMVVNQLRDLIRVGRPITLQPDLTRKLVTYSYPSVEEIRRELADRDLACWCPLPDAGEPDRCHRAVLLRVANGGTP